MKGFKKIEYFNFDEVVSEAPRFKETFRYGPKIYTCIIRIGNKVIGVC